MSKQDLIHSTKAEIKEMGFKDATLGRGFLELMLASKEHSVTTQGITVSAHRIRGIGGVETWVEVEDRASESDIKYRLYLKRVTDA